LIISFAFKSIAQPVAKFSFTRSATCIKPGDAIIVSFRDESDAGIHSTEWAFGDGGNSTNANPTWTYTTAGVYYVTLTIKTQSNETSSVTQQIVIFPLQDVNFVADLNQGCPPLKVVFTDLSKDLEIKDPISGVVYKEKISSRQWTFGDGALGTSESATITHTYVKPGSRDVVLSILYESGCSAFKQSSKSFINTFEPAFADFYLPPPNTCQYPVSVQSINNSANASTYKWSVQGPAQAAISNDADPNPVFVFQQPGTYKVKLIVTTVNGCTSESILDYYLPPTNITASFTSVDSTCANTTLKFTNTSIPDPIDNKWFVNGVQVGSQKDLSYLFSAAGSFVVKLEAQIGACSASSEKTIRVNPLPRIGFSADTLESCTFPFTVNFYDSSTGSIVRRVWEFGDGTSLTEKPPYSRTVPHVYTREGIFSVKLSLLSDRNCVVDKYVQNLITIQLPKVIKANMPDSGCIPFKVSPSVKFANESDITSWEWDYTDLKGNVIFSTSGPIPEPYTFTDSGRYLVKLKIATTKGCDRTFSWTVKAGFVPKDFDFTATPRDTCASTNFKFQYQGDSATGFKWFFNGADSLTERDPMKKFKKLGPVNVRLVVYQYGCPKELIKNAFVNVRGVIASFASLDGCGNPLDRVIVDNSTGNIQNWLINYGDGVTEGYTAKRDTLKHTYSKSGQYTVSLKVDGDGCDYIDSVKLNIADERKLDFTLGKFPVCVSDTFMNLIAVVDNPKFIKSYNWDLGCDFTGPGGSATLKVNLSSLCKYPTNGARGLYAMRLRVVDTNNCVITTPVKNIYVGGPVAGYSALSPTTGCANLPVNFKDNTSGDGFNEIISKTWDFGDGTTPRNILSGPVSHIFSSVGTFPVRLTVTDASGCSSTRATTTVITSDPDLDFLSFDTASCPGKNIQLEAKSSALLSSYFWNLDEGKTSAAPNPRVSYSITGQKTISLTIKDLIGCEKTITKPNYLYIDLPSAEFVAEKDTADCPPFNAGFSFKGKFADSYSWDFGDGNTSSLRDPRHLYIQAGTYPISLTVTSPGGCVATTLKPLTLVVKGPKGTTNFSPTLCEPYNAQFNVTHSKSNFVLIDYGDGNLSDTLPVADRFTYAYSDTGLYLPKVFLLNDVGCRVLLPSPNGIRTIAIEPKFTPNINFLCDNGAITFTDRTYSNEVLTNWKWDFGNGKTGSGSTASTFYDSPGFYSVKLTTGSQSGCFDSLTRTAIIEVQARPDIAISTSKSVICEDDIIQFEAVEATPNNSPVVKWFWDFTNGNSSTLQSPVPQPFRKVGTYPFRLYVTNSKGCSDTLFQNFIVNANPVVDVGPDRSNLSVGSCAGYQLFELPRSYHQSSK